MLLTPASRNWVQSEPTPTDLGHKANSTTATGQRLMKQFNRSKANTSNLCRPRIPPPPTPKNNLEQIQGRKGENSPPRAENLPSKEELADQITPCL